MEEGKKNPKQKDSGKLPASFTRGAVALVFLIILYQLAQFIHRAALTQLAAHRDRPDTVYVMDRALAEEVLKGMTEVPDARRSPVKPGMTEAAEDVMAGPDQSSPVVIRKEAPHSAEARTVRESYAPRPVESFRFNPNTVSAEDLQRLGFSEKQVLAIVHYREKGGRFRRKEDFAKSFVVADSVYERLAPFIDIPRLDINRADSTELLALPGIGPYFAGKVVAYRQLLGGYSCPEQLLEIYHFDQEKYDGLKDLICCSQPTPYPLWELPEEALAAHPHISREEAHGIVLYRRHHSPEECTLEGLKKAGVLSEEHARLLGRCKIDSSLRSE